MRNIPNQSQPVADTSSGKMTQSWWSFFSQQFGPQKTQTITPGASPWVFSAPTYRGVLMVSGGTVSSIGYSQDNTTFSPTGQTQGCIPMAGDDYLKIAYSVAPILTYVPL